MNTFQTFLPSRRVHFAAAFFLHALLATFGLGAMAEEAEGNNECSAGGRAEYYVAPVGTGDGTLAKPGSLATAMAHTGWAASIGAGDTVYLRAGTYENGPDVMDVKFSGADGKLVTWRNHPNERAIINHPIHFGTADYHRFQGLEFCDTRKETRPEAIGYFDSTTGRNNEWINCIIHDTQGVWTGYSGGRLIRGCIIWHAGKHLRDHIVYPYTLEFSGNIVGWTSGNAIELGTEGIQIRSNIMWGGGLTIRDTTREILLVFPGVVANNCIFGTSGRQVAMHIHGGGALVVTDNISCADTPLNLGGPFETATVTGNTFFSPHTVLARNDRSGKWTVDRNGYYSLREVRFTDGKERPGFAEWKANNYDPQSKAASPAHPPDSVTVFRNADEPKRAHIAIYNWTGASHVAVDVSKVLAAGDQYALYSAQNLLAGPIMTGTLTQPTLKIPMAKLTAAPVLYCPSLTQPEPTTPEFGVFVLFGKGGPALPAGVPPLR